MGTRHGVDGAAVGGSVEVELALVGDDHHATVGGERDVLNGLAHLHAVEHLRVLLLRISHCAVSIVEFVEKRRKA